jgi:hypothetical protein
MKTKKMTVAKFEPCLVAVLDDKGKRFTSEIAFMQSTLDQLRGMGRAPWSVQVVPLSLALRAPAFEAALKDLVECPDLNLGNLEEESESALREAERVLALS